MSRLEHQYALLLRASDGERELVEIPVGEALGPVDFGWRRYRESPGEWLCLGSGLLAGGIVPGSNRLIFTGYSPVWDGFYVSTMGGAALIWDGLGISFLGIQGRAERPSVLVLEGAQGAFPRARLVPVDLESIWQGYKNEEGFYALQHYVFENLWEHGHTPRVLAVGPAALHTDMGAIGSSRTSAGKLTSVDCWAGRGGLGSRLLRHHNICALVYGGDFEDEDLTDRAEADGYFERRFQKKMLLEDLEATTKYRYHPEFKSGGTFGVNFSTLADWMLSFNYRSVNWPRVARERLWQELVRDHYLAQFNRETIETKQFSHCGESCPAVCKKLVGKYKKDYEPYQTMGPLSGIFDQRAAERVNHIADALGFDAIQIGGQIAWLMECLHEGIIGAQELGLPSGVPERPVFEPDGFDPIADSEHNAEIALSLLRLCTRPDHVLSRGMREAAASFGPEARARAVYLCNGPRGWMVPNQYWAPGALAPMAVMGKYYMHYGTDFLPPLQLGKKCAERMRAELLLDNAGVCRFHRGWAEKLWPELAGGHCKLDLDFAAHHARLAREIHAQGKAQFWESRRMVEILAGYLRRASESEPSDQILRNWLFRFEQDADRAAHEFWMEMRRGIEEELEKA